MAALTSTVSGPDAGGQSPERLRMLRELGARAVPSWAALDAGGEGAPRLVIAERAERRSFGDAEVADWIRDARRMAALDHPNVARVRDVIIREDEVLVLSDFVDGVTWRDFTVVASLESTLRVMLDVLAGLSALHGLRDANRAPLRMIHGGLGPDEVVLGLDGIARILGASRPQSTAAARAGASCAHLAPEILLEDESADARADVYSVGVLLWEALCKRAFLPNLQPSAIVSTLLSGRVPPVTVPADAPWAAPLAAVVGRALSADPEKRFPSAAAMAAELRRAAGARVPTTARVTAAVRETFGDAVRARRAELERGEVRASGTSIRGSHPALVDVTVEVEAPAPEPSNSAPTLPPRGEVPAGETAGIATGRADAPLEVAETLETSEVPGTAGARDAKAVTVSAAILSSAAPVAIPDRQQADDSVVAAPFGPPRKARPWRLLVGIAATAVLVASVAVWMTSSRSTTTHSAAQPAQRAQPAQPALAATAAVPSPAPPPVPPAAPAASASAHASTPTPEPDRVSPPDPASAPSPTPDLAPTTPKVPSRPLAPPPPPARARSRQGYDPQGI